MTAQPTTREEIAHHIDSVWTLAEYIAWLNRDGPSLSDDLDQWKLFGVTTAAELGDYLDGCCARNVEKSERN